MNRLIFLLLSSFCILSCSDSRSSSGQQAGPASELTQAPEVLTDNGSSIEYSILRGKRNQNIIEQLFSEALSKNQALTIINSDIEKVRNMAGDSLQPYHRYFAKNNQYFKTLHQYANQLSDSSMQKELSAIINNMNAKFDTEVLGLTSMASEIALKEKSLRDQEIIMKIMVTQPLMRNYQLNEKAEMETLNRVKKSYETVLKEMEPYTQLIK